MTITMEFLKNKFFIGFVTILVLTLITISLINNIDYEELLELYRLNEEMKNLLYNPDIKKNINQIINLTREFKDVCDEQLRIENFELLKFQDELGKICMEFIK